MSQSAPPAARNAAPRFSLARVGRLARKELRETLRDRRTIVTLVLMPLLVYSLLSLGFKQFLAASLHHTAQIHWRIAVESQSDMELVVGRLLQGEELLRRQGLLQSSAGELLEDPPLEAVTVEVVDDLEAAVKEERFDVGMRVSLQPEANNPQFPDNPHFLDVELIVRPHSALSRQVADYLERRLRAVNDDYVQQRLRARGDSGRLPSTWRQTAIEAEERESAWFAALVPLVLILMTITGAVYPAIDLTAGERERGTLESLMAAPVPRLALLVAKYVAVVTVAMLTAVMNLLAMTITLAATGLAPRLLGEAGLTPGAIAAVLALLVLFAAFFSAVLLSITSFARSFKEAQAYLIPLMLVSLAPGFMSVMPGLELGPLLSVTPLANIVLLARDVLEGDASPLWGSVAVLTTALYGALALAVAARVFGSDAILYGSHGTWSDLFRRPAEPRPQATPAGALSSLAIVTPLFVVASGVLAQLQATSAGPQLATAAAMSIVLFIGAPMLLARGQGVALRPGFQWRTASPWAFAGAIVLGCTLWTLAYDLILLCQDLGIATLSAERLAEHRPGLEALIQRWRELPLPAILLALGVVPAVAEELFFRGYLLGSLRGRMAGWLAIGLTAAVFGLFHASVGGLVAIERIAASTLLGVALGWVCWTTRSVVPGMILHALNNCLMLSLPYYAPQLQARGWDMANQRYLPWTWLLAACLAAAVGLVLVWLGRRGAGEPSAHPAPPTATETSTAVRDVA